MSLLKKLAKKSPVKTSNSQTKPVLEAEELSQNIARFIKAKKQQKDAKANIIKAEHDIIKAAQTARSNHCTRTGKYESSYKVSASTGTVTVKFPNRYSKISSDDEDVLKEIYGSNFEKFFKEKTEAHMTQAAIDDEAFVETMMNLLGEEKFVRYFEVSSCIEPEKTYHEQRTINEKLAKQHEDAKSQGLVSCSKPSLLVS